jgi:hypothetical protein
VAKIVKEKDVQEYVKDLRARFYGALEEVLFAVIQYVKHGKDGGMLGYRMLVDAGVIPQKDGRNRPAIEKQWSQSRKYRRTHCQNEFTTQ